MLPTARDLTCVAQARSTPRISGPPIRLASCHIQQGQFLLPSRLLYFAFCFQGINKKNTNMVESWSGTKEKQSYTHSIFKNASFTFTWAFQRTNQGQDVSPGQAFAQLQPAPIGWSAFSGRSLCSVRGLMSSLAVSSRAGSSSTMWPRSTPSL